MSSEQIGVMQPCRKEAVSSGGEVSRVLLLEWDVSRVLDPADTFARQEKEALLREVAGALQQTEGGLARNLIERGQLIGIFRRFLADLGIHDSDVNAESLAQQLTERNFVLCFAGADRCAFVHWTFLEYFCAAWFVARLNCTLSFDQLKLEVFGRHWRDENWHQVLRLIAGMVGEKEAGELISFLMSLDGRSHKLANLMLAAGCLSEVRNRRTIHQTDQALLKRFFEDAIRYDPPYSASRPKCVGAAWRSDGRIPNYRFVEFSRDMSPSQPSRNSIPFRKTRARARPGRSLEAMGRA